MSGLRKLALEFRHLRLRSLQQRSRLYDVEFGRKAHPESRLGQSQRIVFIAHVFSGDQEPALERPDGNVVACGLGQQSYAYVACVLDRLGKLGLRGFHSAPEAAEDIQFPARVEAGFIHVLFSWNGLGKLPEGCVGAVPLTSVRTIQTDTREERAAARCEVSPLFAIPRNCYFLSDFRANPLLHYSVH